MSGVLSHPASWSAAGGASPGTPFVRASKPALAANAPANSSEARVAHPRYMTSRSARLSAYCMTGT